MNVNLFLCSVRTKYIAVKNPKNGKSKVHTTYKLQSFISFKLLFVIQFVLVNNEGDNIKGME